MACAIYRVGATRQSKWARHCSFAWRPNRHPDCLWLFVRRPKLAGCRYAGELWHSLESCTTDTTLWSYRPYRFTQQADTMCQLLACHVIWGVSELGVAHHEPYGDHESGRLRDATAERWVFADGERQSTCGQERWPLVGRIAEQQYQRHWVASGVVAQRLLAWSVSSGPAWLLREVQAAAWRDAQRHFHWFPQQWHIVWKHPGMPRGRDRLSQARVIRGKIPRDLPDVPACRQVESSCFYWDEPCGNPQFPSQE